MHRALRRKEEAGLLIVMQRASDKWLGVLFDERTRGSDDNFSDHAMVVDLFTVVDDLAELTNAPI
jgi:hypothetical protein